MPEAGSYYFIEDQVPDGYAREDRKFSFSIDSTGLMSGTTSFVNKPGTKGVKTGDESNIIIYLCTVISAMFAVVCIWVFMLRKKGKGKIIGKN